MTIIEVPKTSGPVAIAGLRLDALSTWALAGAACGLVAAVGPLPTALKALLLLVFVLLGPGSALLHHWAKDLPAVAVRALVPVTGLAIVILAVSTGLFLGRWSPRLVLLVLAALTGAAGGANRRRFAADTATLETNRHTKPAASVERSRQAALASVLLVLTAVTFLDALPSLHSVPASQYGLLVSGPRLFTLSLVLDVVAFAYCIRTRLLGLSVVALVLQVLIQRLPTLVSTQVALYSWTYKHLGVVDYIQQHGALAHGVDVYHGWPGLFASTAWFCDLTGMTPEALAHGFTVVLHLGLIGLVYALARCWNFDPRGALLVSFLVESLNWVGQDYYSPQATAIVLAVGFLLLIGRSRERVVAAPVALILFAALVISHQLTPYWLILVVLVLTVTRRLRSPWLPVAMIAITGAFLAFNYDSVRYFNFLSFNPFANARSNIPTHGVTGQRVTSAIVRSVSALVWGSAAICAFVRWRRRDATAMAPAVLAFSSFLLLGGASYGGEAIFRVFLYSLFGCAFLVAPVLIRFLDSRPAVATRTCVVLVAGVVAAAQGLYGGWFANLMAPAQVREAERLLLEVEFPSFITPAAPNWPERASGGYVRHVARTPPGAPTFDYPMIYETRLTGSDFATIEQYNQLVEAAAERTAPTYLIITRQMQLYDWYFGILPYDALPNLERWLRLDNRWTVYRETADYVIYRSTPALIGAR